MNNLEKAERLELEALRERDAWRSAAMRIGEDLSTIGPKGYYGFTPEEWLEWAIKTINANRQSIRNN